MKTMDRDKNDEQEGKHPLSRTDAFFFLRLWSVQVPLIVGTRSLYGMK
jgi:hypothetical protein